MSKALIVTVGGDPSPIINLIKAYKNEIDFIYFIASSGNDKKASIKLLDGQDGILSVSGWTGKHEKIAINDPDSLEECYKTISEIIKKAKEKNYEIIADFSGGTKTMSCVLAMLAVLDFDITPSLTIGPRTDTIKISGESRPVAIDVQKPRLDLIYKVFSNLVSSHFYHSACSVLERTLIKGIKEEYRKEVQRKQEICRAFALWDTFEYEKAFNALKNYAEDYKQQFEYLLKILKKNKCSGYEPVFDLIENAERQASNGYYDNATARIYRALELFSQTRLKTKYDIDTSHLEKSQDKINMEKWKAYANEKGEIQIGLMSSYELLNELKDDVGKIYDERKDRFIDNIKIRNASKLAHGDNPIDENNWQKIFSFCKEFLELCCNKINIKVEYPELPNRIL